MAICVLNYKIKLKLWQNSITKIGTLAGQTLDDAKLHMPPDLRWPALYSAKGQLISKCLLVSSILPKNELKIQPNYISTMVPEVELFSFVFWKN